MPDILTAALLAVPIMAGAAYLLRKYPRETFILASEGGLYALAVFGYMALTLVLVPLTAPAWLQVLSIISFTALGLGLAPTTARRIIRRLNAANAEQEGESE